MSDGLALSALRPFGVLPPPYPANPLKWPEGAPQERAYYTGADLVLEGEQAYRASLGRRRTFATQEAAHEYDEGWCDYPTTCPDKMGTPRSCGYFDHEQQDLAGRS